MLQAYIDDSGMGQPPASVLAGWVATAESWAAFSDEWKAALDMRPRIAYFKMAEAAAYSKQFNGFSQSQRDEKVSLLFSIIERHAIIAISSAVPDHLYKEIFSNFNNERKFLRYPYFLLFTGILLSLSQHFSSQGSAQPIDFIFDSQPDQIKRAMRGWEVLSSTASDDIKPLLANPPIFRDDKTTLPLQAADFHAWWTRRMCETHFSGKPEIEPPWHRKRKIPSLEMFWREEALKRMRAKVSGAASFWPLIRREAL